MSKFMTIAGIVLAAVAIALGLMIFFSTSSVVAWGLTPHLVADLLVGGILAIGLGGVISVLERNTDASRYALVERLDAARSAAAMAPAVVAAVVEEEISPATSETLRALDEAKSEIHKAFGEAAPVANAGDEPAAADAPEAPAEIEDVQATVEEEADAAAEEAGSGELYVIEEKIVRGRPARVLSDGTIEAETDEGWMRFENLDHLNEYLDAMAPG